MILTTRTRVSYGNLSSGGSSGCKLYASIESTDSQRVGKLCTQTPTSCGRINWSDFWKPNRFKSFHGV